MAMTRCPSCQAELEVPDVVPGGQVACPYCAHEFAPGRGGPAPVGVSRRPRRRPAPRRGGAQYDDGYDEGYGRAQYGRRRDPTPIIVAVVALGVLVIGGLFLLLKSGKKTRDVSDSRRDAVEKLPSAEIRFTPPRPDPYGSQIETDNIFIEKDMITIMNCTRSENVIYNEFQGESRTLHSFNSQYKTKKYGETITAVENGQPVHEGTYLIQSFFRGVPTRYIVDGEVEVQARFRTNGQGYSVPGTFEQTGGANLPVAPEFVADRCFGVLPTGPIQQGVPFGADTLQDPISHMIVIDGRPLRQVLGQGRRLGGWMIVGKKGRSDLSRREDGRWTRQAKIEIRLQAVENHPWRRITYGGQPAQISCGIIWEGSATILLMKQVVTEVKGLGVTSKVHLKTDDTYHRWVGEYKVDYQMYKDP